MNKAQLFDTSTLIGLAEPTIFDADDCELMQLVTEYCDQLEQGLSTTPECFAEKANRTDARLLEMLQSVQLLHRFGGNAQVLDRELIQDTSSAPFKMVMPSWITERPGGIVGDYRILREVGRGAMGYVYEAEQISLARRVALKILPPAAMLDERQIARFNLESQFAAKLHHSNIVPVYGVGNDRGVYFYSMQFIEHRSFQFPMDPNEVAKIGEHVALALHCAHREGVIHRDIKPSNLLLDRQGKIWVTDFGLARLQKDGQQSASGTIVGTMRYMSPEQACGSNKWVDHRTDIYALGVTLYEMLTGRCPYDATDRVVFLAELERGEPTLPRQLNAKIPVDLETIILKAMASHPDDRYATAEEMAADLNRFLSRKVIYARRPSWQDRLAKWIRRNQGWVAVGVATWIVFTIGIAFASIQLMRAERATHAANLQAQKNAEEANRFFNQARDVVDHFGVSLSRELSQVPGAKEARIKILRDTLRYYREFIAQVGDDPDRKPDLAATHLKIARIAEQLHADNEATLAFHQAETILSELPNQSSAASLAANSLGLLFSRNGSLVQADAAFQRAIAQIDKSISKATPQMRLESQHRKAIALVNRAHVHEQMQRPDQTNDLLLAADGILNQLDQDPYLPSEMRRVLVLDRAKTLGALSRYYARINVDRALVLNGQAIDLLKQYCFDEEKSSKGFVDETYDEAMADWLVSLCNRARLLELTNQSREAIECVVQAIELGRKFQGSSGSPMVREQLMAAERLQKELLVKSGKAIQLGETSTLFTGGRR